MYNKKVLIDSIKKLGSATSPPKKKDMIIDPRGQWAHPGQNTRIPSNNITMDAVPYPVYGDPNVGSSRMMYPEQEYNFPGADYVDEYPQINSKPLLKNQYGGELPKFQEKGAVQLLSKGYNLLSKVTRSNYNPLSIPIKKIGYKIASQHPGYDRSKQEVLNALLGKSKSGYFGNSSILSEGYGPGERDLNKLYFFGNETGFLPVNYDFSSDPGLDKMVEKYGPLKAFLLNSEVGHGEPISAFSLQTADILTDVGIGGGKGFYEPLLNFKFPMIQGWGPEITPQYYLPDGSLNLNLLSTGDIRYADPKKIMESINHPELQQHVGYLKDFARARFNTLFDKAGTDVLPFDVQAAATARPKFMLESNPVRPLDNLAGHMGFLKRLPNKEFELTSRDIWGFSPSYDEKWGMTTAFQQAQRKAMEMFGKPFVLTQTNPIKFRKGGDSTNNNLSVKQSNIQGKGLFINKPIKKGETIGLAHVNGQATPMVGKYHNHSEDNPTAINVPKDNKRYLVASRDLPAGTEITTNYRLQPELEQPENFMQKGGMTPQKDGYRTYSPFKNLPYIDVETDTIDTDNIVYDLQLMGDNGVTKNVQKNTGLHKIPGANVIREIPMGRKGGSAPRLPRKKNSRGYSRSLEATNKLFAENSFFAKQRSRKNKIYDPNAKYYQEGGASSPEAWGQEIRGIESQIGNPKGWSLSDYNLLQNKLDSYRDWRENTPEGQTVLDSHNALGEYFVPIPKHLNPNRTKLSREEEESFQNFYQTLPDNLMQDEVDYDLRGYWDGLGRPEAFDYSQPTEADGYYHAFSINPNTGEYLKSPAHETFQHAVDEDRKIGYRPVTNVQGRNIAIENESIIEPEAQSFLRNMTGPVTYAEGGLHKFVGGGEHCPKGEYWNGTTCVPGINPESDWFKLTDAQKRLLEKGNNLATVEDWYKQSPEQMEMFKAWIDEHDAETYLNQLDPDSNQSKKFKEALDNDRQWNQEWYTKRKTLPQFKDVAERRLAINNQDMVSALKDPINLSMDWWKTHPSEYSNVPEVFYAPEIGAITRKNIADYNTDPQGYVEASYYTDANGRLQNSTITHEESHIRDHLAPQKNTTDHIKRSEWNQPLILDPLQKIITAEEALSDPRNKGYAGTYQQQPTEFRARLKVWRKKNGIDPLKNYTEEELKSIIDTNLQDPNLDHQIKELYETIKSDPSKLKFVHDSYVSNDSNKDLDTAEYGGLHKFVGGGEPCPPCPDGTIPTRTAAGDCPCPNTTPYRDKAGKPLKVLPKSGTIYVTDLNDPKILEYKRRQELYEMSKKQYSKILKDIDQDINRTLEDIKEYQYLLKHPDLTPKEKANTIYVMNADNIYLANLKKAKALQYDDWLKSAPKLNKNLIKYFAQYNTYDQKNIYNKGVKQYNIYPEYTTTAGETSDRALLYPKPSLTYVFADPKKYTWNEIKKVEIPPIVEEEKEEEKEEEFIPMPIKKPELISTITGDIIGQSEQLLAPEYYPSYPENRIGYDKYNWYSGKQVGMGTKWTLPKRQPKTGGFYDKMSKKVEDIKNYMEGYEDEDGNHIPGEIEKAEQEGRQINFKGNVSKTDKEAQEKYTQEYNEYENLKNYQNQMMNLMQYKLNKKQHGGISLQLTKDNIQKYVDGGYIVEEIEDGGDPDPLDPHQLFLKNWYENRVFPKEMQKAKPILLNQLEQSFPPYVPTDALPTNVAAAYNYDDNIVELNKNYSAELQEGSKTHENNHYLTQDANEYLDKPHTNLIEQNIINPKDINTGNKEWDKAYKENFDEIVSPEEMHSRIMTLRELAGFKPDQVITEQDVEDYFESVGDKLDPDVQDIKQVTKGNKAIVELLNYMASNNSNEDLNVAKYGGTTDYELGEEIDEATMKKLKKLGYTFETI